MKNYNNFINEDVFSGLKNIFKKFGSMFGDSKEQNEEVLDFAKKIQTYGSLKKSIIFISQDFITQTKNWDEKMENLEGTNNQAKIKNIEENLKYPLYDVYYKLKVLSQITGNEKLLPFNLYEEATNPILKKMFSYQTDDLFGRNLPLLIKGVVTNFCKKAGIPEEQMTTIQEAADPVATAAEQSVQQTTTGQDVGAAPTQTEDPINENMFNKVKEGINTFVKESLYGALIKQLKTIAGKMKDFNFVPITQSMDQTQNKDSLNKIFQKIATADKETLIKVRDFLGINKDDAPL